MKPRTHLPARSAEHPRRATDMWAETEDGQITLLSDSRLTLQQFKLDGVGAAIWMLCDGHTSVEDIVTGVRRRFSQDSGSHERVRADVEAFLHSLEHERMVEWLPPQRALDVLLVFPPAPSVYSDDAVRTPEFSSPPLGLCFIAAALRAQGRRVAILDLHQAGARPEDVLAACRQYRPRIVGVSAATPSFPNAARIARFVKAYDGNLVTILGGAHASALPRACLAGGEFDYVCVGEGEHAMAEFTQAVLDGSDAGAVPGIASLRNGSFRFGGPRPFIADLDQLPMPARDLIDVMAYHRRGAMISARGCPIGCTFCACPSVVGSGYRVHGLDRVMAEIHDLRHGRGIRTIDFHDDTFNLKARRVSEFCDRMLADFPDMVWGCFCRARQFSTEQARHMVRAGCRVVQFGVESGNEGILGKVNKKTNLQDIEQAVSAAAAAGVDKIVCGFIIGFPYDTEDTIRETIDFGVHLAKRGATRLALSVLTPYPGTEIYERRDELGITMISDDWEEYTFSRIVQHNAHLSQRRLQDLYVEGVLRFMEVSAR